MAKGRRVDGAQYRSPVALSIMLPVVLLVVGFLGIWYLSYLTPMHSDDFRYKMLGLGLQAHINQYLHWSGRLVADYLSPLILHIQSKPVRALVQACGLFALMAAVIRSAVSFGDAHRAATPQAWWLAALVMLLFVLSMPDFGQAYMWVVGSANYLWPALLYSLLICLLLGYVRTRRMPWYAYPLAVLAGCTNENASVVVVCFVTLVLAWQCYVDKKPDARLVAVLVLTVLGAAVLLGAPGNYERLQNPAFAKWRALTWPQRIWLHVSDRIWWNFTKSKLAYLLCFGLLAYQLLRSKRLVWFVQGMQPTAFALSVLFLLMSLGASLVMLASPDILPRTMTAGFVFTVFSVAFGVRALVDHPAAFRNLRRLVVFLTVVAVFVFAGVVPTYMALPQQAQIRHNIIAGSVSGQVDLPNYYMGPLISSSYDIDTFYSEGGIRQYFHLKSVHVFKPGFNYAVINRPADTGQITAVPSGVGKVWVYSEKNFLETMVVAQLENSGTAPAASGNDSYSANTTYSASTTYYVQYTTLWGRAKRIKLGHPAQFNGKTYVHARIRLPRFLVSGIAIVQ